MLSEYQLYRLYGATITAKILGKAKGTVSTNMKRKDVRCPSAEQIQNNIIELIKESMEKTHVI